MSGPESDSSFSHSGQTAHLLKYSIPQNKTKVKKLREFLYLSWSEKKKKNVCRITLPKSLLDPMDVALSDAA